MPVSCLEILSGMDGDSRKTPIDLRTCGDPKRKPKAQADGSIGYEIPEGGYFYYAYVGKVGGTDILSLRSSGGGSGHFTALVGVRQDGRLLRWVRDYAGGDRCNGGISNESVSNGKLTFDQAITPYDLVDLAQLKTKLAAYKDLEASAASCIGVVHLNGDTAHWTGVTLTEKDWSDQKGWTDNYRYQACFNQLYRQTVATGHAELDRRGVAAFGAAFARRCLAAR
ncbi:hypothetical protein [Sphingomonas azotifigens]|uniref:hypothetical protein n=1 Tax=Sphingomonas azotifigens TaxID=330920 RepID=UPI001C3F6111|nr:hypothetical protein [Sphingomonas azotifigens]